MPSRASQPCPDLSCCPQLPTGDTAARARISGVFRSIISWLRTGYPDEAPRTGYSPLLALNGPMSLTPRQIHHIVDELGGAPADRTDIEVAITKITDRLPTQTQTRAVTMALHPN